MATILNGIAIWGAVPGSPAAELGVRYGDIVLRVNGVATPTIQDFVEARALSRQHTELELFRDGQLVRLTLVLARSPRVTDEEPRETWVSHKLPSA